MFPQVSKVGDGYSIIPSVVALPQEERLTVGSMKVGESCLMIPESRTSPDLEGIRFQNGSLCKTYRQ